MQKITKLIGRYFNIGGKKVPTALFLVLLLAGCAGYVPGRQSYWDEQVKEMCKKDGGVTIFDQVQISKRDVNRHVLPMTANGRLGVAIKELAHPDAPVYGVEKITYLRKEGNPRVSRTEFLVIRRADQAVVAKWIFYSRVGGDLPTGIVHDSSFVCPAPKTSAANLSKLFIVESDSK